MSDNKVSKPSKDEFIYGVTHGDKDTQAMWGLILRAILGSRR